jgi:hypothetical protein
MAQRPLRRKATIKDDRRLASAQWLNGLGSKSQQSKGIKDWHWHDGSRPWRKKATTKRDGRLALAQWLNGLSRKKQQSREVDRRKGWPWHLSAP